MDSEKKEGKVSNDFDWVKDVKARLPLRVGTCLTFKHSKEEEEWVEDEYGNMIDHGKMNWHITSKFIDVYNDDKPTFSMVATDRMGESRQIFMEVEKVKELYEEGVYEPCKKQPYLKRVMKEESDDFDWVEDVSNTLPRNDNWMLINDVDPDSLEVSKDIQNYLFSKGLFWNTGRKTPLYQRILAIHYVLPHRIHSGSFTYVPNSIPHEKARLEVEYDREELLKKGKHVYYWSQLKPEKDNIKESKDLKWIEDIDFTDPKKPKRGYVYDWKGYSDSVANLGYQLGEIGDIIIIKEPFSNPSHRYPKWKMHYFDTLNFDWGEELDGISEIEFNRKIDDGTITYLYKLGQ
mgnify:FL=1